MSFRKGGFIVGSEEVFLGWYRRVEFLIMETKLNLGIVRIVEDVGYFFVCSVELCLL